MRSWFPEIQGALCLVMIFAFAHIWQKMPWWVNATVVLNAAIGLRDATHDVQKKWRAKRDEKVRRR